MFGIDDDDMHTSAVLPVEFLMGCPDYVPNFCVVMGSSYERPLSIECFDSKGQVYDGIGRLGYGVI